MTRVGLALGMCLAAPCLAEVTYASKEAEALSCVNMFATAAVELEDELSSEERAKLFTISVYMLRDHVSGSWQEKDAAMKVIAARRSTAETVAAFRKQQKHCLAEFPVAP